MRAPTHIVFGIFSATSVFSLFSAALHKDLVAVGAVIIGSLLPDIDSPKSTLGRLLPFASTAIERQWGHRTITHGLLMWMALAVLLLPLCVWRKAVYGALLIGYLSHLLIDCATKAGVPLFYPHTAVCVIPGNGKYRVKTGSLAEQGVLIVLLLLLLLVFPISSIGGTWKALRYLMATQSTAYSDYRESTTETVLEFEGRWRASRQPVEGRGLILEGSPTRFLIAFGGQVWSYGEQGDILPDQSRVEAMGKPIRLDTLRLNRHTYGQIMTQIPEGAFVSGVLRSSRVLRVESELRTSAHVPVQVQASALQFAFAPRASLAAMHPVASLDSAQVQQLVAQIEEAERMLIEQQIRRPPVHYLQLRELETEIAAQRQRLETMRDSVAFFDGTLYLRRTEAGAW
jgi:membrane-bound metal-dependent hydrolase YbcI (DUF457 family)/uncharacterized coiled-coil protein SlyX